MKRSRQQGRVRIIGGTWRSRLLDVAVVDGLRPTSDRVRETLFNWLAPVLPGARVLDLFAGTGVLSFEALSRGAAEAVLVEQDRRALGALQRNRDALEARCEIVATDAFRWVERPSGAAPFDVVFIDPPFAASGIERLCTLLHEQAWLSADARVYLEQPADATVELPAVFERLKQKTAGRVRFALYGVASGETATLADG